MAFAERFYPESRFGGFTDVDGTVSFFGRVNALLEPSFIVLDIGCGRGECADDPVPFRRSLRILRGKVARVLGIDVDEQARDNPFVDEFRPMSGPTWPVDSAGADLALADNVLEHVVDPPAFFAEAARVLRPGGYLCIRTPNRWSYVALASSLVPHRHHARVLRAVQDRRGAEDVFPTVYRCNDVGKIRRMLDAHGFAHAVYGYEAEPSYLSFSSFAYRLGVLHQRFAPRFVKPTIFAFGCKKPRGHPSDRR